MRAEYDVGVDDNCAPLFWGALLLSSVTELELEPDSLSLGGRRFYRSPGGALSVMGLRSRAGAHEADTNTGRDGE